MSLAFTPRIKGQQQLPIAKQRSVFQKIQLNCGKIMFQLATSFNVDIADTGILEVCECFAIHCYRDHTFPTKKDHCVTLKAEKGPMISMFGVFIVRNGFPETNFRFTKLGLFALMVQLTMKRSQYRNQLPGAAVAGEVVAVQTMKLYERMQVGLQLHSFFNSVLDER